MTDSLDPSHDTDLDLTETPDGDLDNAPDSSLEEFEAATESPDDMSATAPAHLLPQPAEASGPRLAYSAHRHRDALRQASDRELLLALKEEDEAALDELMDRKTGPLIQTVYRILHDREDSRDIVQITFVRLWEHRDRYDQKWAPNTWIYRIATNLAIDHLRSRQSKQRQADPLRLHVEDRLATRGRSERSQLKEREVMAIFEELSAELTEKQRSVFVLREVEGMPSKEVAEIVGCRESTVRNHLFNARKTLRQALVERYPEYAPTADLAS